MIALGERDTRPPGVWVNDALPNARRIVDLGCGTGAWWWHRLHPDATVVGVDHCEIPPPWPVGVTVERRDVQDFAEDRVNAGRFDLVVASHILEHVPDTARSVAGYRRLLRPGGRAVMSFPEATQLVDRIYRLVFASGGGHINRVTLADVRAACVANGLREVQCRPYPAGSWEWLRNMDLSGYPYLRRTELESIADAFLREFTLERGYSYGFEMVCEAE